MSRINLDTQLAPQASQPLLTQIQQAFGVVVHWRRKTGIGVGAERERVPSNIEWRRVVSEGRS